MVKNRGQDSGDVDLAKYLANVSGPVPLELHYPNPNDIDRSLNEVVDDKIRKYRADYNNNPPNTVSFIPAIASTSTDYIVNLSDIYSYRLIGKLTVFLQLQELSFCNQPVEDSSTLTERFALR